MLPTSCLNNTEQEFKILFITETKIAFNSRRQDFAIRIRKHDVLWTSTHNGMKPHYIKPHFDYCSVVWSNSSNFNVNKINKLQRRARKLILSHDYKTLNESLEQLDIFSFDQSVFLNKAKLMYTIYNNLAPSYLVEMFHMREFNLDNTTSNLRSVANKHYVLPQAKCDLFKGILSFSDVLVWNSIPLDIKNSSSLQIFMNRCSEWMKR